tara:strand:+ start:20 stop:472 length:453 start_codon:yes stop_codon:yes gene_type:complete
MTTTATVENHALDNAKAKLEDIIEFHKKYNEWDEQKEASNHYPNGDIDKLLQDAQSSVLSIEYRQSCWQSVGSELKASQGRLLLTFGGPACQIITDLDEHGEPSGNVEIQYQDWFKPWEGYWPSNDIDDASNDEVRAALEWYVGLFFFGQ